MVSNWINNSGCTFLTSLCSVQWQLSFQLLNFPLKSWAWFLLPKHSFPPLLLTFLYVLSLLPLPNLSLVIFGSDGTQTLPDALLTCNLSLYRSYHLKSTTVVSSYSCPRLIQGPSLLSRPMLILPLQWKSNHYESINWFLRERLKVAVRWLPRTLSPQQ